MPTPKTEDEIKAEVKLLRAIKPKVRRTTAFGDDNHAAIEAQIRALEEGMDEDEICDKWDGDGEDRQRDDALYSCNWKNGYETESPSDGWKSLVMP
jgi:hypothetical protein